MTPVVIIGAVILLVAVGYEVARQMVTAAAEGETIDAPTPAAPVDAAGLLGDGGAMINAMDRGTWPTGDKVWRFCQAVAYAEGYGADPLNAPTSHHNPGDLGPGDTGYPGESHGGSVVSMMPDDATGWAALYQKWSRIFAGHSSTFPNAWSIQRAAMTYAGDWRNWSKNVSSDLGVPESMRLIDWYNSL